jgi:hypothetical protein
MLTVTTPFSYCIIKKMRSLLWKYIFIIILVIIPLILVAIWFRDGRILGGGDEELLFINTLRTLDISETTFVNYGTGYAVLFWLSRYTFLYAVNFIHIVLLVPVIFIQAGTFYFLMITGIISVYFLVKQHIHAYIYSGYVAFLSATFYLLNPYSMTQIWGRGQYAQYFSFAVLPLALLIFTFGIRRKKYIYSIVFALTSLLFSTAYGFLPFSLVQWLVLFLYIVYEIISGVNNKKIDYFPFCFFILSLICWMLVQLWWFLPLILTGSSVLGESISNSSENIGTLLGVSQSYPLPIIIRLLQSFYFFSEHAYSPLYAISRFQLTSWIPVVFLLVGTFAVLKSRIFHPARFFLVLCIVGLIISLGANPPTGFLFVYVFEHVPVLQMFRNPYEKAGLLYMLGYAPLFGIGFVTFFEYFAKKSRLKKKYIGLICASIIFVLNIYLFPMWTGMIYAGSDEKIGLSLPKQYYDLDRWLKNDNKGYRVLMTPLLAGDGAWYAWDETVYQGIDPMVFLLNADTISNINNIPYYGSYIKSLRMYVQQLNIRPALELLRVQYLVNRKDALLITRNEKEQYRNLSEVIYPVSEAQIDTQCDKGVQRLEDGTVICDIPAAMTDWSNIRYIELDVKSDTPATFELSAVDNASNRIVWDGRGMPYYQLDGNTWNTQLLPLYAPSSQNEIFDRAHVNRLEIKAHPISKPGENLQYVQIKDIHLNKGEEKHLREYLPDTHFGQLDVYKPTSLTTPPEFGILTSFIPVDNYKDLFEHALGERKRLDKIGFIISSQNTGKNIHPLTRSSSVRVVDTAKISDTKYWLKVTGDNDAYVTLSKTYYPGWKIMQSADKEILNGSFFNNIRLLREQPYPESQHYVANGYANLWKVKGNDAYSVIFIPQLIAEIGKYISLVTGISLLVLLVIQISKQYIGKKSINKKNKNKHHGK